MHSRRRQVTISRVINRVCQWALVAHGCGAHNVAVRGSTKISEFARLFRTAVATFQQLQKTLTQVLRASWHPKQRQIDLLAP